jgi:hypothetical protein
MTAVLLARVETFGGRAAVAEVLRLAASERTPEYLLDTTNWISYDEAVALWRAGGHVTHHPQFARAVGEDAAHRLAASPVATMLRSLGSPENVYRQVPTTSAKFSTVSRLEATEAAPGFAELVAAAVDGLPRSAEHCAWTCGLLSCVPVLFGLAPALVEHDECEAMGASRCLYRVIWDADEASAQAESPAQLGALRQQLEAMKERLHSVFATASDLIAADDLDDVLARITDRAALEVRAIRYMLAVRATAGGKLHCHHRGFDGEGVAEYVDRVFAHHPSEHPASWLVVPVRSDRRDYGRLVAMSAPQQSFLPQERELFEVYARYAASALDGASALSEAKQRYDHSSALLSLARGRRRGRAARSPGAWPPRSPTSSSATASGCTCGTPAGVSSYAGPSGPAARPRARRCRTPAGPPPREARCTGCSRIPGTSLCSSTSSPAIPGCARSWATRDSWPRSSCRSPPPTRFSAC